MRTQKYKTTTRSARCGSIASRLCKESSRNGHNLCANENHSDAIEHSSGFHLHVFLVYSTTFFHNIIILKMASMMRMMIPPVERSK